MNGEEMDVTSLSAEEKRKLRLEYISYVPQGSMSVLNPVLKLKETYHDFLASHVSGKTREDAFEIARDILWSWDCRAISWRPIRTSCPAE